MPSTRTARAPDVPPDALATVPMEPRAIHDGGSTMTVSGDLATIDLADLLQNIETHRRTGTLSLASEDGKAQIFFRDGHVALLARDGRTPLVEMLVATGHVPERKLEAARKKQKGSRRCVAEVLVGARVLAAETLSEVAEDRLAEDVANLVAAARGEFQFVEGDEPGGSFDPDEASLQLSLAVAPLVLEATRRVDHWVEIRKYIPSDSLHFRAREGARAREAEDEELAAQLLAVLDGSRSAQEVVELFPERRFLAFKLLAEAVRDRIARPVTGDDLLGLADACEADQPQRSRKLVRRGLDTEPHHLGLLAADARLGEQLGDVGGAASAHKLLAHLHLEAGRSEEATAALDEAKRLTPADPSIWERSLQLALTQGRRHDALRDGMQLVDIYRAPGLHSRARAVLDRLLCIETEATDLHIEFARTCVDCGEPQVAVKHLVRRAKALVGSQDYVGARMLFAEVLGIEPAHREAALSIEMIDKEVYARRRERKRRAIRLVWTAAAVATVGLALSIEFTARVAYVETRSLVSREHMIEQHRYQEAIAVWQAMAKEHPWSLTARLDVPRLVGDLQARSDEDVVPAMPGR